MLNLEINKKKFQELKKRVAMVGLVAGIALVGTGCNKENENKEIGYEVITDSSDTSELYSYVANMEGFENDKYNFDNALDPIYFAKVEEKEVYDKETTAFFRKNIQMVWPDCFELYNYNPTLIAFDMKMEVEKLTSTTDSMPIVVVNSSMTAKQDIDSNVTFLTDGQKEINKGDTLSSTAIYYEGELVAYKQTGVGSDSQNVIDATVGDVDLALSTVEDYGLLTETEVIDSQDLTELEDSLNEKEYVKTLK